MFGLELSDEKAKPWGPRESVCLPSSLIKLGLVFLPQKHILLQTCLADLLSALDSHSASHPAVASGSHNRTSLCNHLTMCFSAPSSQVFTQKESQGSLCLMSSLGELLFPELPWGLISPVFQTCVARTIHSCCLGSPLVGENTYHWAMACHIENIASWKAALLQGNCRQEDESSVISLFEKNVTLLVNVHDRSWMGSKVRM